VEKAYRYWAEETNAKGGLLGRPVELIIYDDASQTDKAVQMLEKAITVDKVDLILGGYPGTSAAAQMAVAEKYKMVYVSMGGHMKSFTQGYKYSFGSPPLMGQWWYAGLWQWLETLPVDQRPKTAAIFTMNNPVGAATGEGVPAATKKLGINLVINETYDLPLASADSMIAKAKAANADLFIANGSFADGVLTVRAMKSLNYNPKFLAQAIGCIIPQWVTELKGDGNYVFSSTSMHDKLPFPGIKELNKVAQEKFGESVAPQYFLFGYAWLQSLKLGVEGAKSLDQDKIRDYLHNNEISTIGGKFKFDDKGLPPQYDYMTQVINGQVELVWPKEVQTHAPVFPKPNWGN
jgi:branched-chain amino acid transport system substrate-binding protein